MHKNLPSKYYYINKFNKREIDNLEKGVSLIFRDYKNKINENLIIEIKKYCKKKGIKFFLSNNFKISIKLNLDGVYIPSFNKNMRIMNYSLKKKFIVLGSAHNIKEIRTKEKQKVDLIFLSSIFKKKNTYLGFEKFKRLSKMTKIRTIALGGINKKNINRLKLLNLFGFAGISHFKKKTAPKLIRAVLNFK